MNLRRLAGLVLAIGLLMMPTTVGARRRAVDRPTCRVTNDSGAPHSGVKIAPRRIPR
jgi:hypothetical protein